MLNEFLEYLMCWVSKSEVQVAAPAIHFVASTICNRCTAQLTVCLLPYLAILGNCLRAQYNWDLVWDPYNLTAISGTCAVPGVPTAELVPTSATSFVHHSEVKCICATVSALVLSLARVRHQLQASLIFLYFVIVSTRNAQLRRAPAEGSWRLVPQQLSPKNLQMRQQTRVAA